ncbi:S-ribosylhomocysteine lyase [Aerococcaceae bacterium DSM 111176]|nr:S-ribosylhomocysteine lyase [Aerococcaceae bacterium DSM 111176]
MEKIASFTVDHTELYPGLYLSRQDKIGDRTLNSYDLRITAPNREQVMNTGEIHTIEHLLATFLRNDEKLKDEVIYFGPMGCRTGFYAIFTDAVSPEELLDLLTRGFDWARKFEGDIPGASASECGNFLDQNVTMARYYAEKYYNVLKDWDDLTFSY